MKKWLILSLSLLFLLISFKSVNAANLLFNSSFEGVKLTGSSYREPGLNIGFSNYIALTPYPDSTTDPLLPSDEMVEQYFRDSPSQVRRENGTFISCRTGNNCLRLRADKKLALGDRASASFTHLDGSTGYPNNWKGLNITGDFYVSVWLYFPADWSIPTVDPVEHYSPNWYAVQDPLLLSDSVAMTQPMTETHIHRRSDGTYFLEMTWSRDNQVDNIKWVMIDPFDIDTIRGKWTKWAYLIHPSTDYNEAYIQYWIDDNLLGTFNDANGDPPPSSRNYHMYTKNKGSVPYWASIYAKVYLDNDGTNYYYLWADDLEVWDGIPNQESATLSGRLLDKSGSSLQATIAVGSTSSNTNSNGYYSLSVPKGIYDINYSIQNLWIKILSFNLNSNQNNLVNYITKTSNQTSFQMNITNNQLTQLFSDKRPNNVTIGGVRATEVFSLSALTSNTWFYQNNILYINASTTNPSCGNGAIDSGEVCELPNTNNNNYCSQSASLCDYTNRKYCTRDNYGNCNNLCQCVADSWSCGSADNTNYCSNCNHCGDGSVNCGEICEQGQTQSCTGGMRYCLSDCSGWGDCKPPYDFTIYKSGTDTCMNDANGNLVVCNANSSYVINRAITNVSSRGEGSILVQNGDYSLSDNIDMKSNVTVALQLGVTFTVTAFPHTRRTGIVNFDAVTNARLVPETDPPNEASYPKIIGGGAANEIGIWMIGNPSTHTTNCYVGKIDIANTGGYGIGLLYADYNELDGTYVHGFAKSSTYRHGVTVRGYATYNKFINVHSDAEFGPYAHHPLYLGGEGPKGQVSIDYTEIRGGIYENSAISHCTYWNSDDGWVDHTTCVGTLFQNCRQLPQATGLKLNSATNSRIGIEADGTLNPVKIVNCVIGVAMASGGTTAQGNHGNVVYACVKNCKIGTEWSTQFAYNPTGASGNGQVENNEVNISFDANDSNELGYEASDNGQAGWRFSPGDPSVANAYVRNNNIYLRVRNCQRGLFFTPYGVGTDFPTRPDLNCNFNNLYLDMQTTSYAIYWHPSEGGYDHDNLFYGYWNGTINDPTGNAMSHNTFTPDPDFRIADVCGVSPPP